MCYPGRRSGDADEIEARKSSTYAGGLSLIEHVVRAASAITPLERITVVMGHQAEEVKQPSLRPWASARRTDRSKKGTGHAVIG